MPRFFPIRDEKCALPLGAGLRSRSLGPDRSDEFGQFGRGQSILHQPDLLVVDCGVDSVFDVTLEHVIDVEIESHTRKRTDVGGVAGCHGLRKYLRALLIGSPDDHHDIVGTMALCELFDY